MKPDSLHSPSNLRGNWLGKVVQQAKQALSENDLETFENLYTDTMTALHWKFKPAQQLDLPFHGTVNQVHIKHHSQTQLKLFAA